MTIERKSTLIVDYHFLLHRSTKADTNSLKRQIRCDCSSYLSGTRDCFSSINGRIFRVQIYFKNNTIFKEKTQYICRRLRAICPTVSEKLPNMNVYIIAVKSGYGRAFKVVSAFKYPEHRVTETLVDEVDKERERRRFQLGVICWLLSWTAQEMATLLRAYCQTFTCAICGSSIIQRSYTILCV